MRVAWYIAVGVAAAFVLIRWVLVMTKDKEKKLYIAKTFVNSFHYLAQDADFFRGLAANEHGFERVRLCRTAVLLYVFSLEALVNRCMDHFLPADQREFFLEKERALSTLDKFQLVPLLVTGKQMDKANDPVWAKLKDLFRLRDEFVHPKHDRAAYIKVLGSNEVEPLEPSEIPSDFDVKSKDVEYPALKVPRDPYSILPEHLDRVKDAAGDVLQKLDELLEGRVLKDKWHTQDQFQLVYPPGATWQDVPPSKVGRLSRQGKELRGGHTEKE